MRSVLALWAVLASTTVAAQAPQLPPQRDGVWLQNGLKQYERSMAHETLSSQETSDALVVTAYVCAVTDLEKYLVQRAALLAGALDEGKNKKPDSPLLDGMRQALPIALPLVKTDFATANPTCEQTFVTVRTYLDKYPEMLAKDAEVIVDRALLDAFTHSSEP